MEVTEPVIPTLPFPTFNFIFFPASMLPSLLVTSNPDELAVILPPAVTCPSISIVLAAFMLIFFVAFKVSVLSEFDFKVSSRELNFATVIEPLLEVILMSLFAQIFAPAPKSPPISRVMLPSVEFKVPLSSKMITPSDLAFFSVISFKTFLSITARKPGELLVTKTEPLICLLSL